MLRRHVRRGVIDHAQPSPAQQSQPTALKGTPKGHCGGFSGFGRGRLGSPLLVIQRV